MLEQNLDAVSRDFKVLIGDAQELLSAAASMTGDKAEQMRQQGILLMEAAIAQARETHAIALESGRRMALSTNEYVRENPWKSVGTVVGIGLLVGVLLNRSWKD